MKSLDQIMLETQQGKHQTLLLHFQHLGFVVATSMLQWACVAPPLRLCYHGYLQALSWADYCSLGFIFTALCTTHKSHTGNLSVIHIAGP